MNKIKSIVTRQKISYGINNNNYIRSNIKDNDKTKDEFNKDLSNQQKDKDSHIKKVTLDFMKIDLNTEKNKLKENKTNNSKPCFSSRNITMYKKDVLYNKKSSNLNLNNYLRGIDDDKSKIVVNSNKNPIFMDLYRNKSKVNNKNV